MPRLDDMLMNLPAEHREALAWFADRSGQEIPWPDPLPSGLHLVNRAKGIHKPRGWRYALSVKETLSGQYDDKEPEWLPDGSFKYEYYQEGDDPAQRDAQYTNRGLIACMEDRVPVAVLRQTKGKLNVRYRVLGLALVQGWNNGWFSLESVPSNGSADNPVSPEDADTQPFSPNSITDARERTITAIVQRRGQAEFRRALIEAYDGRCAITGCDVLDVLEAAHIHPYRGTATNKPSNGLLLRADLHTLFDLGLVAIDPHTWRIRVATDLYGSAYAELEGNVIAAPELVSAQPSREALTWHWEHLRSS